MPHHELCDFMDPLARTGAMRSTLPSIANKTPPSVIRWLWRLVSALGVPLQVPASAQIVRQRQLPEIIDVCLPPQGCSLGVALVGIRKAWRGHARRVMMGVWSHLRRFMKTQCIAVVDQHVGVRDWKEMVRVMTTHMGPARDTMLVDNTAIDCLDVTSPVSGWAA